MERDRAAKPDFDVIRVRAEHQDVDRFQRHAAIVSKIPSRLPPNQSP
jgi:hypothetical protein